MHEANPLRWRRHSVVVVVVVVVESVAFVIAGVAVERYLQVKIEAVQAIVTVATELELMQSD
jgi:hypothetical protein